MKRRVFLAVNLPEDIKKRLLEFREKWETLFIRRSPAERGGGGPVRWTKKDSLHLTLVFIGYADEEEIYEICRLTRSIAQKHEPFLLEFEKILYGPPNKTPRMIWLKGKPSGEIAGLKEGLESALSSSEKINPFKIEKRPFSPHITLARINMGEWYKLKEAPVIEQDFKFSFNVASVEVMESDLKYDGAEYTILESCPLGK